MTDKEAIKMMKAKLQCITRNASGCDQDCNTNRCDECDLCYEQGNIGQQKEWLKIGIKALEKQKIGHWIDCSEREPWYRCSECGERVFGGCCLYCPYCGAKMKGEQK